MIDNFDDRVRLAGERAYRYAARLAIAREGSLGSAVAGVTRFPTITLSIVGLAFTLVTVAVLVAVPPANGYEPSIYAAFPPYFWVALIGAFFVGQLVIFRSARDGSDWWKFGLAQLAIVNGILALMPAIRGYPLYGRADTMTHVGYVRDLAQTAGLTGNIYPSMHVLLRTLSVMTGVDPIHLISFLPPIFTIIFFGGMCLLVVHLFDDRHQILYGFAMVAIPVGGLAHVIAMPFLLSILFVPFVLYLFVKEQRTGSIAVRAAMIATLVAFTFYHPLTTVFLMVTVGLYCLLKRVPRVDSDRFGPTMAASVMFVSAGAWYANLPAMVSKARSVYLSVLGIAPGDTDLENYSQTVSQTTPDLLDLLRIGTFRFGVEGLVVGLTVVFNATAAILWWRDEYDPSVFTVLFGTTTLLFSGGAMVFLVRDLIVGMERPMLFARLLAVVLAGILFYLGWRRLDGIHRHVFTVGQHATILLLVTILVLGMFPAPLNSNLNHQVTYMELEGTDWMFEHRNEELPIDEYGIRQFRFHDEQYGTLERDGTIRREGTAPPAHFNYTEYSTLGQSYDQDSYLLLTRRGRIAYPAQFPDYREYWQFTPGDFDRLETDESAMRIYDSGEYHTYYVAASDGPGNVTAGGDGEVTP